MLTKHVYLSAEDRNERSYTRTHILCLNDLDRGKFTFFKDCPNFSFIAITARKMIDFLISIRTDVI